MLKQFSRRVTQILAHEFLCLNEVLRSPTDSTIFTSLFHSIASVGKCEQVHTSVLNLIFQQTLLVQGILSK